MERSELIKKAVQYIKMESTAFFSDEVRNLIDEENLDALNEAFYKDLEFGTGGLRGIIGGGSNRMNTLNVKKATQGLANYINELKPDKENSAVIAYDSRNFSEQFALDAALVLAGNNIKAYLFSALRPTPELSFAVRHLKADAGIVVTASHNPPEYNGYKVVWDDGAQITKPHDSKIIENVRSITDNIHSLDEETALKKNLLVRIDAEIDRPFLDMCKGLSVYPELLEKHGSKLKVVYTPLHGTGAVLVPGLLRDLGVDVIMVESQAEPDGNFPTVDYPNPEEESAMKLALDLARKENADLVIGTDPDADRIGIAVPEGEGFTLITGNQLGALLAEYLFSQRRKNGTLPAKPAFINTIVTTNLQNKIAREYGVEDFKVLTGFKYICGLMRQFEESGSGIEYVFGCEESYGFLAGTDVRDKDAVSTSMLTVEMALFCVTNGKTVIEFLHSLYEKYGYYEETLVSKYFKGELGYDTMSSIMAELRNNPPKLWGGIRVSSIRDYKKGTTFYSADGRTETNIDLPQSNVLQWELEDGTIVTVRPSGTEPKIKFYASGTENRKKTVTENKVVVKTKINDILQRIKKIIGD